MIDVVDQATRSRMMAGIRGRDTRPEMTLRRTLHAAGFRFRLHIRDLPGTPDLVLPRFRSVLFVHGCFWHRHPGCRHSTTPATRPEFWASKFDANERRDRRNTERLLNAGWRVGIVWECALKRDLVSTTVGEVTVWITSPDVEVVREFGAPS